MNETRPSACGLARTCTPEAAPTTAELDTATTCMPSAASSPHQEAAACAALEEETTATSNINDTINDNDIINSNGASAAPFESAPSLQLSDCMAPDASEKAESPSATLPRPAYLLPTEASAAEPCPLTCAAPSSSPIGSLHDFQAPASVTGRAPSLLSSAGGSENASEGGHSSPASLHRLSGSGESDAAAAVLFQPRDSSAPCPEPSEGGAAPCTEAAVAQEAHSSPPASPSSAGAAAADGLIVVRVAPKGERQPTAAQPPPGLCPLLSDSPPPLLNACPTPSPCRVRRCIQLVRAGCQGPGACQAPSGTTRTKPPLQNRRRGQQRSAPSARRPCPCPCRRWVHGSAAPAKLLPVLPARRPARGAQEVPC